MNQSSASAPGASARRKTWYFTPALPLKHAAPLEPPFRLASILKYLLDEWRPLGLRFIILVISIVIWTWFTPAIERAVVFQADWMLEILIRNLVVVLVVAGGLHWLLYVFRNQDDESRYIARPFARNSRIFHFRNQVRDNMFWTLCSSVPVGAGFECLMLWGYANGHIALLTVTENPGWFIGLTLLVPVWSGIHFYWYHRLLHVGPLYKHIHSWHHKNVNIGPWSGHAMHPLEHIGLYSDLLIYFLIASHPVHVIFNAMLHTIGGPVSHCGYHRIRLFRGFSLQWGDFYHQLHHRFIDCNYGTPETPWDRKFGSFHDGTEEGDRLINERRRALAEKETARSS